jgi:Pyruvate/2-oxoacid:ferredoxin oxidoreductase delta subunit
MSGSEQMRKSIEEVDFRRREFLRALLPESGADVLDRRAPMAAEQIALLKEVAARWDGRLAPGAIPQIEVSDTCAHHGVCASVCPTAALRTYAGEGHAGLEFDAAACIACGVCAMVCPEKAIAIRALPAAQGQSAAATRISRHEQRCCACCDDEFAARGNDELCPACRKDVGLFTHGFSARSDET